MSPAVDPRLRETPTAPPSTPGQPTAVVPSAPAQSSPLLLYLLLTAILGFQVYGHFFAPSPQPGPGGQVLDGKQIGEGARVAFAKAHASALRTAADQIASTELDMSKIKAEAAKSWAMKQAAEFDRLATPALDKILPPGTTPTPTQRAIYADFLRDIADAEDAVR